VGTVFVKHFELALDARRPDERRRLETRFLVAAQGGWYGITYKWNAEGTEAEPLFQSVLEPLTRIAADGTSRVQSYYYPSPSDCLVCHNADAGHVLGVRTAQLNGPALDAEGTPIAGLNQLVDWSERGILDTTLDAADVAALPSLAPLSDATRSPEDRVRSYLDANCSMCHGENPNLRATWDARYSTPLGSQGIIDGALSGEAILPPGTLIVTPGDPEHSALWLRDGSNDPALRMPPLGRQSIDSDYLAVLEAWIESLR
jgi:mono/diheme cytochrome c family protein